MSRYVALAFVLAIGCGNKPTEKKPTPPKPTEVKPPVSEPVKTPVTAPAPATTPATVAAAVPAFSKEKKMIYDPRVETKTASVAPDEAEKILGKVFTKRLKKIAECKDPDPGSKETKEDIESGQIVPSVITKLSGAFTAPGLTQDLYFVDVGECNAPEARESAATSSIWVLVENGEIKAKLNGERANYFIPVDVDQNGTSEILTISGGASGGGSSYQYADLYMLSDKEAKRVEELTTHDVMNDTCSVPREDGAPGTQEAMVVSMTPTEQGKLPTFSGEKFTGTCEAKPTWKPVP